LTKPGFYDNFYYIIAIIIWSQEAYMRKYRELGLKLTPQRLSILSFLENNRSHPTADEIYRNVVRRFPTMSLATVYNTLETLKARGKLNEVTINPEKRHFDPDMRRHHHAICTSCKKITDIFMDFDLSAPEMELGGFKVTGSHVEFYGICPDCAHKASREKQTRANLTPA
jgi:Fur family transcriptional regulator, peroxide stress response regulator